MSSKSGPGDNMVLVNKVCIVIIEYLSYCFVSSCFDTFLVCLVIESASSQLSWTLLTNVFYLGVLFEIIDESCNNMRKYYCNNMKKKYSK